MSKQPSRSHTLKIEERDGPKHVFSHLLQKNSKKKSNGEFFFSSFFLFVVVDQTARRQESWNNYIKQRKILTESLLIAYAIIAFFVMVVGT